MKVAIAPIVLSTASLGLMLGVAENAQAALIPNITASTNMGSAFSTNIANTVNGAGLPSNTPSLTGSHAAATVTNAWFGTALTGNITFNLNGSYSLAGFSFWNFNGQRTIGIKGVTVQSSTDGTTWTTIAGAPVQFAIASNAPIPPAVYSFSPVTASFVRFVVASNWGLSSSGFSEVQFDGTPIPVPEPSSLLALLAFGLAGVGLRKLM
ncbi:MAG: discoidin domain-containing protein [Microcystis aeruginosa LG11-05]|nr:discoidin domain-containing protein [Microcystis aeruginosa LG13-13]NCR61691.1 discoidin domain-containing protein [Microcystis aeruginosa LG11-05]